MGPDKPVIAFEPTHFQEWIDQIKKDLRDKNLSEMDWKIDAQISMSPFQHPERHQGDNIISTKRNTWQIGRQIDLSRHNLKDANNVLITALANGLNAPEIIFQQPLFLPDFGILLDQVREDYISFIFTFQDYPTLETTLLEYDQYLTAKNAIKESNSLHLNFSRDPLELTDLFLQFHDEYPKWRFFAVNEHGFVDDQSKIISSSKCIQASIDLLKSLALATGIQPDSLINRLGWYLESSRVFYVDLCRLRAMRWAWGLLLESWNQESYVKPYFDISIPQLNNDPNLALIEATAQAMSNAWGGADRITILMDQPDHQRLGQNIQSIMQLESKIDQLVDPAQGSYYLERLTEKIADSIWSKIVL